MSNSSSKKRKTFIDLSDDNFFTISKSESSTEKNIIKTDIKKPNQNKPENNNASVTERPVKIATQNTEVVNKEIKLEDHTKTKNTVISDSLNIIGQEVINKGFHFYSNDRVMDKVKRCAKEKNIKLSRLITIILDKTIKEE